jgi:hypothetical protein
MQHALRDNEIYKTTHSGLFLLFKFTYALRLRKNPRIETASYYFSCLKTFENAARFETQ